MKIVVTVKLVPDPNAEKRIDDGTKRLVRTGVETVLNPVRRVRARSGAATQREGWRRYDRHGL